MRGDEYGGEVERILPPGMGIKTVNKDTGWRRWWRVAFVPRAVAAETVRNDSAGVRLSVRGPPNH